jgi:hypothetical protein
MDSNPRIHYLFSKNQKIGSYIIRLGSYLVNDYDFDFNNIPSHVAVLVDDTYVIESVMSGGVRIIPYNHWLEHNTQIMKLSANSIIECPRDLMFEMWGKPYDKVGILRFAIDIVVSKLFKLPMPDKNEWEQEDAFFCTEFASRIYDGDTGSTRTPVQLMRMIYGPV